MIGGMVPPSQLRLPPDSLKTSLPSRKERAAPSTISWTELYNRGCHSLCGKRPLRVIPACMIGSGIAGGLSMPFKCTLMAPHGGIFVFAVVGNWPYYLLSLCCRFWSFPACFSAFQEKRSPNKKQNRAKQPFARYIKRRIENGI